MWQKAEQRRVQAERTTYVNAQKQERAKKGGQFSVIQ